MVNAAGIGASRGVALVLGFLLVPFMIKHLGKEDYGIYQLVRSFRGYLPLLTLAVGPAVLRYVTYAVGQQDRGAVNRHMSTGVATLAGMSGIMFAVACVLAVLLPDMVDLGGAARESQILLVLLAASTAVSLTRSPFSAPLYSRERLAEASAVTVAGDVIRFGVNVAAFALFAPSLTWVGLAALAGALCSGGIGVVWAYRVFPWMQLSRHFLDRWSGRQILPFSVFSSINTLVGAIYYSTDAFIIKWLYGSAGPAMITVYFVGACWDPWIRGVIQPLTNILTPRMTLWSAEDRVAEMRALVLKAIRYTTVLIAPICIFISVFARAILTLWLGDRLSGEEISTAAEIMPVFLIPLALVLGLNPAHSVFVARAKIAVPTLVTLAAALVNLVLSVVLAKYAGWGLMGLAVGTGLTMGLRVILFTPFYLKRTIDLPRQAFWVRGLLWPVLLATLYAGVCLTVEGWLGPASWWEVAATFVGCGVFYVAGTWIVVVLPEDRRSLADWMGDKLGRGAGRTR